MNPIKDFEANNIYFPIILNDCGSLAGIYCSSTDNNIYKTNCHWGDGTSNNATFGNFIQNKVYYPNLFTGILKLYNNPSKVIEVNLNIGISGGGSDPDVTNPRNVEFSSNVLDYFFNCEKFYFTHYAYNSNHPNLKGKITGEWAIKCGSKLKSLEMPNVDYPGSTASFNLDLIPVDSVLELLKIGSGYSVSNGYLNVSGNLGNLPPTCKIVYLGGDRPSTSNSVSGMIPNWVEEFQRSGRNTISGNIANLSPNLRILTVQGANTITGFLPYLPYLNNITLQGNNTVKGSLANIINGISVTIGGMNEISGAIPNMPNCVSIAIQGNNTLSGVVPAMTTLASIIIAGSNTLSGTLSLPNATTVNILGNNNISAVNLPKVTSLTLGGASSSVGGDIYTQVNSNIIAISISGNNTISAISGTWSSLVNFNISGANTLSGNVLAKVPNVNSFTLAGNNTMNAYVSKSFGATMNNLDITGSASLTTAMVDQLFIDLAQVPSWGGTKRITVKGNCGAPSSVSAAARANLAAAPKTVTILTN